MNKNHTNTDDRSEMLKKLKKLAEDEGLDPSEIAANIASQLDTFKDKAKAKLTEVASQVDETARRKPWYFMGAAAVLGYLISIRLFKKKK
jgi:ElaB/YqjD/DUF883 family membrane-anchored ribosome-binding protein